MIFYYESLMATRGCLDIIEKRAAKLVSHSENLDKWETCAYSDVISFCNSESLKAVRKCWAQYCHRENSAARSQWRLCARAGAHPAALYQQYRITPRPREPPFSIWRVVTEIYRRRDSLPHVLLENSLRSPRGVSP